MPTFTVTPVSNGQPNNFQTIQAAANAAANGDTIEIFNGTYAEQVFVNKDLTFTNAAGNNAVIVDGSSFAAGGYPTGTFQLQAGSGGTTINGLRILAESNGNAIVSEAPVNGLTLTNNAFETSFATGQLVYFNPGLSNALIDGNTFTGPNLGGPLLGIDTGGPSIVVSDNVFGASPGVAIETFPANDPDVTYSNNVVADDPVVSGAFIINEGASIGPGDVTPADGGDEIVSLTYTNRAGVLTTVAVPSGGSANVTTQYGTLTLTSAGEDTYVSDQSVAAVNALDTGESVVETYSYTSALGGTGTVTAQTNGVDDAPVDNAGPDKNVVEDTPTVFTAADLATDPEGDAMTITGATPVSGGTVVVNPDGTVTFTPSPLNSTGAYSFNYTVTDADGNSSSGTANGTVTNVNDAPIAGSETVTTNEDVGTFNDQVPAPTDPDVGDTFTYQLTSVDYGTMGGTLTLNSATGAYSYTPGAGAQALDNGEQGEVTFTYTVTDAAGAVSTPPGAVVIDIVGLNDAPVDRATPGPNVTEDTPTVITADQLATDVDVETLTITAVSNPTGGTVVLNPNGTVTFTPSPLNNTGAYSFDYTVSDGTASTNGSVTGTITAVNDAPTAGNDSYNTNEDTTLIVAAPGVKANDNDVDGDPLTTDVVTGPANGTLTLNDDGSFTYTPNANYSGTDTFTYTVNDGTVSSAPATVTINVASVNDPYVAIDDELVPDLNEDGSQVYTVASLLANDIRNDQGEVVTVESISHLFDLATGAQVGNVTYNVGDANFTITLTSPNYNGRAYVDYVGRNDNGPAPDETDTGRAFVDILPINDAPSGTDQVDTALEDVAIVIDETDFGFSDVNDVPADTLEGVVLTTLPTNGTLFLNGVAITTPGTFVTLAQLVADQLTFQSDLNENNDNDGILGPNASFTFQVRDTGPNGANGNGGTNVDTDPTPNTYQINVTAVNDAPDAVNDAFTGSEDDPITGNVLANDTDVENDTLTVTGFTQPANGSVTVAANGNFTFTPNANFFGTTSFNYTISDGNGGTDTATVTLTVNADSDRPVAGDDSNTALNGNPYITFEDAPARNAVFEANAANLTEANGYYDEATLLANDTDPDGPGGPIVGSQFRLTGTGGAVNGTAEYVEINGVRYIKFTPNAEYSGPASFDYAITDLQGNSDTGRVNLVVDEVADGPPVAVDDSITAVGLVEQQVYTITAAQLLGNDTDPDGLSTDRLILRDVRDFVGARLSNGNDGVQGTADDGNIQRDAQGNILSFEVITLSDVNGATASFNYVVDDAANRPNVQGDTAGPVLIDPTNPEGQPQPNTGPGVPRVVNVPDLRTGTDIGTVTLNPSNVNDVPVANNDPLASLVEDDPSGLGRSFNLGQILANDTDADNAGGGNGGLTVTQVNGVSPTTAGVTNVVNGATVVGTLTSDGAGNFTFRPAPNFNGTASISYTVSDAGQDGIAGNADDRTSSASVLIPVTEVNDVPVVGDDSPTFQTAPNLPYLETPLIAEDRPSTFTGVLTGFNPAIGAVTPGTVRDDDGDPTASAADQQQLVIISASSTAGQVTFSQDNGGTIVFTPNPGFLGTATITYTIRDNGTTNGVNDFKTDSGTLTFTVVDSVTLTNGNDDYSAVANGATNSVRINGLDGNDTITGTEFVDEIYGDAGNDTISGLGGDDRLTGGTGDDTVNGNDGNDFIYHQDGGTDTAVGGAGNDGFYYGAALNGTDTNTGGTGDDTLALAGNYGAPNPLGLYVLTPTNLGGDIENLFLASGQSTGFPGQNGGQLYQYNLGTRNANVAANGLLTVQATELVAGENVYFDGSDEQSGGFRVFAGQGVDRWIGGAGQDGFFFITGAYTSADIVDGRGNPVGMGDTFGLRGFYNDSDVNTGGSQAYVLTSVTNVENIALLSGRTTVPGVPSGIPNADYDYNVTLVDANGTAGTVLTVNAAGLTANENVILDASAETNANLTILSGAASDEISGGVNPGFTDYIFGGRSGDRMNGGDATPANTVDNPVVGGDGTDVYLYTNQNQSQLGSTVGNTQAGIDVLEDFDFSVDKLDINEGGPIFNGFMGARGIENVEVVDVEAILGGTLNGTAIFGQTGDSRFLEGLKAALDDSLDVGIVDAQGDLNVDSAFLQVTNGDYAGRTVFVADTNGNGVVDVDDLIIIFENLDPGTQLPPIVSDFLV